MGEIFGQENRGRYEISLPLINLLSKGMSQEMYLPQVSPLGASRNSSGDQAGMKEYSRAQARV